MSETISLVILRFEVANTEENLEYLTYIAPGFVQAEEALLSKKKSYAAVVGDTTKPKQENIIDPVVECQGNRKFTEIIIETFHNEYLEMDNSAHQDLTTSKLATQTAEPTGSVPQLSRTIRRLSGTDLKETESARSSRESSESEYSIAVSGSANKTGHRDSHFKPISDDEGPGPAPGPGPGPGPASSSRPNSGTTRPKSHSPTSKLSPTIHFYSGNPMVERVEGILHLYKDNQMTPMSGEHSRSELICMIAVPGAYTIHDLLKFTAPVGEGIEYLRIIRDSTPNQYMVLVKFKNQDLADEFFVTYNNTQYNSIEPDICHLVYIAKVESMKETDGASFPASGMTELPCCPVCLERMDESVEGVLTILCNHAFHTKCLAQWGDTSCPVCRYCQTPEEVADNRCMKCGSQESLWICLICGHVGCGRYVELHAYKHFQETQHTYAMQLGDNRVWDYVGDNYVHRLIQSKGDGKLVQVDQGQGAGHEEKLDSLNLEYTYLLTSQLESQRCFFEEKIELVESDSLERTKQFELRLQEKNDECEKIHKNLKELIKDKSLSDKKSSNLHSRLTKVLSELQEEKEMNKCLRQNQSVWQKKVEFLETQVKDLTVQKEQEIQELREQLRDVMFYLEAQQKLASTKEVSQDEIMEGQVIVGATAATPSPTHRKTRKKDR